MSNYAPVPGKIPGTVINLGGHEFVMPPLNLDGCQRFGPLQAEFLAMQGAGTVDLPRLYQVVAQCLHLALERNYPDLTVADIVGLLDAGTLRSALTELATVSGFVAAGEATPATG